MVQPSYNPFTRDGYVSTEHGVINRVERRYFTHRRPEHVFKKYQSFNISITELEMCYNEHVEKIVIKYHGKKKNIIYGIDLEYLKYMKRYDNNGDEQVIIPIKEMKVIGEEVGLNEHETETQNTES